MTEILFIGCGRTTSAIALELLVHENIDSFYLYSRTINSSKKLLDILKKKPYEKRIEILEELEDIDLPKYIIIALSGMTDSAWWSNIKKCVTTQEARQGEVIFNFGALLDLGQRLKGRISESKIIILTNPADDFTNYLQMILETKHVYGFGLELDAMRYGRQLGKTPLCIGLHGEAVPIIGWKERELYSSLFKISDNKLLLYAKEHGIPYGDCGKQFKTFFRKFEGEEESVVMMSTYLSNYLGISDKSLSIPVVVKKGEVIRPLELKLNEIEREKFHSTSERMDWNMEQLKQLHEQFLRKR